MLSATSATPLDSGIPVVDIGPLRDNSNPGEVARQIHDANRGLGFLYVCNHGLPEELIAETRGAGLEFFRQPESVKREVCMHQNHRGFLGIGDAKMYRGARSDLKESFVWGAEPGPQTARDRAPNRFEGANRWPSMPSALQRCCRSYLDAAHQVAQHLLRAFALGLSLPESTFLAGCENPISRASLIFYPPQAEDMGAEQFGVAPHTDFGVLTVLAQDRVGGLEVQGLDGRWLDARPLDGTLVVNVGDLLKRWTNGHYHSTPHRVVNRSNTERLSLVLAYDPAFDTLIDSNVTCASGEVPKEAPIRCGEYLEWRFRKSFAYRDA